MERHPDEFIKATLDALRKTATVPPEKKLQHASEVDAFQAAAPDLHLCKYVKEEIIKQHPEDADFEVVFNGLRPFQKTLLSVTRDAEAKKLLLTIDFAVAFNGQHWYQCMIHHMKDLDVEYVKDMTEAEIYDDAQALHGWIQRIPDLMPSTKEYEDD